jgi:hypothetical protein
MPPITRRTFLQASACAGLSASLSTFSYAAPDQPAICNVPMRAVTKGPKSHWFGYYDKHQFDPSNRYMLGMEVGFDHRSPQADDEIRLGVIDLQNGDEWRDIGGTTAWCWQQGCMLQWLPGSDDHVIYNARHDGGYHAVIQNIKTGDQTKTDRPIYAVNPSGTQAVGVNINRLGITRPGYGYNGFPDEFEDQDHPKDDGIYSIDLKSGSSKLIISYADIVDVRHNETMENAKHWFNHLLFSPDGKRFIFLHRWRKIVNNRSSWYTRMFTVNPDGTNLHVVADHDMVSHFIWKNPKQILAWSREENGENHFHLYTDQTDTVEVIGYDVLKQDGHCTYSPDEQWVFTDTYPDENRMQHPMLYRPSDGKLVKLGQYYLPPDQKGEIRCDLHPRWSRDGKSICIDSLHSGKRQLYLLDVSEYTLS